MERFCKECGEAITGSLNFCQHCGHQLKGKEEQVKRTTPVLPAKESKKYTKKQKIMMGSIAGLLVLLVGFYMWGNSYYSPESTIKRFVAAINDEDIEKVQHTSIVNGEEISEAEAEAFIRLVKEEIHYINFEPAYGEDFSMQNDLFKLVENGKSLLIFPNFDFSLVPQFAALNFPFGDVVTTFNGEEFPVVETEEMSIVYGPIAPGKYDLKSSYTGEFTEIENEESIILASVFSEYVHHDVELDGDMVTFDLYNMNGIPIESGYLEVNDQEIPFDENFRIEALGPLHLNGSVTVTPVAETPWGVVRSEAITLEDNYYEINMNTVSESLSDELSKAILLYGEDYVKAHAVNDAEMFTNITDHLKGTFESNFEYYASANQYFSGQLDSIEIEFDELFYDADHYLYVPVKFHFTSAFHRDDEDPDLGQRTDYTNVEFIDDKDDGWLVNSSKDNNSWFNTDFVNPTVLDGSKELAQASVARAPINETDFEELDEEIEEITLNYIYGLVDAINANDYEVVRPFIKDDSLLHPMQEDLVDRLEENGMTQEVITASVTDIEERDDHWVVVTDETIKKIYESGEEETNDYVWTYTVERDGDGVALTNIE